MEEATVLEKIVKENEETIQSLKKEKENNDQVSIFLLVDGVDLQLCYGKITKKKTKISGLARAEKEAIRLCTIWISIFSDERGT